MMVVLGGSGRSERVRWCVWDGAGVNVNAINRGGGEEFDEISGILQGAERLMC